VHPKAPPLLFPYSLSSSIRNQWHNPYDKALHFWLGKQGRMDNAARVVMDLTVIERAMIIDP